jgi:hypothetical protein
MNVFRVAAVVVLLTGPAYAQKPVLLQDFNEKTPQQKADDELKAKFSKESPTKIPEPDTKKSSVDPWGQVRSGDAAKTSPSRASASKTSDIKTSHSNAAGSAKPRTKTGATAE